MTAEVFPVEILLSTFNGEKYLSYQLESLKQQSYRNWRLLVRDDGSSDATPFILEEFAGKYPERVWIIKDGFLHLGLCKSLARLLEHSKAPYILFCDQDDFWHPEKIAKLIAAQTALEAKYPIGTPMLTHCDLEVVDEKMMPLAKSFWKYQKLNPASVERLGSELMMNAVTGCALLVNRPLLEKALPIPEQAIMYDWWLALVAAGFGQATWVNESLVRYRQHRKNLVGAKQWSVLKHIVKPLTCIIAGSTQRLTRQKERQASIAMHLRQAAAFRERYARELTLQRLRIVEQALRLYERPNWVRPYYQARYGLLKTGFLRNLSVSVCRYVANSVEDR